MIITQGDYFGEEELLENRPRGNTAVVRTLEAQILSITREV